MSLLDYSKELFR
jgi:syntaxin-binding protein 1